MAYRNIAYNKQKDNTKKKKNKKKILSGVIDQRVQTAPMRKKKKYTKESMFPKAREEARKNVAKPRPFGEAFRSAKDAGKKVFLWKGKSFHTKTKAELETGKSEKEKFERAAKSKKVPSNQSNWNKFKGSKTLAEFFGKLKK